MARNLATLGDLERAIMDAIWERDAPCTAYELRDRLEADGRPLVVTTILTVLGRLELKGFVTASKDARPHQYRATLSRADAMAELMHDVLGAEDDHLAVLERFVGRASAEDTALLRRLLGT